jgi:hypothetical protein
MCSGGNCGPDNTTILDQVIQEVAPDGTIVWSWDAYDHIPVGEMDPEFAGPALLVGAPYDVYHWNSFEYTDTGIVMSFRHLDAVYDIDHTTGDIIWKLGGSPRPESLTVLDDPLVPTVGFGGQHDARMTSDGILSLHDNGTARARPPREVRYQIDTTTTPGTATMIESLSDAGISSSFCCGSARKLPGGNWVTGWGSTPTFTESTPAGSRVFTLTFGPSIIMYRAVPVLPGVLDRAALRAGMDAQYHSP